jgi:hypothetical protein
MSSNLSVINFAVGGTLTISGMTTLAETILSSSTASFQGVSTTSLTTTGTSTFNNSLPTSSQIPTLDNQLTTKVYVDIADTTLNTRITDTDSAQRTYLDTQDTALGKRITDTDATQKTYIDEQYTTLNTRITDTDSAQRTYLDTQDTALGKRITDTDAAQRTYIDTYKPNDIIQMKVYNSPNKTQGGLTSTNAKGTTYTILFSDIFVSKSNSSTIQVIFDCQWGISGVGFTNDSWKSSIFINGQIIATKVVIFNNDSRNSSVVLFPISAAIINDTKNKNIPISIQAAAIQANPDQTLTLNTYNVTFIEIQN